MSDNEEIKNVFSIIQGGATEAEDPDATIINTYVIVNHDGEEYFAEGFLMPTSQHVMVMRETPQGALPILVVPLDQIKYVEIVEEDDED